METIVLISWVIFGIYKVIFSKKQDRDGWIIFSLLPLSVPIGYATLYILYSIIFGLAPILIPFLVCGALLLFLFNK